MMELTDDEIKKDLTRLEAECKCVQPCVCKYLNDDIIQMALTALGKKSIIKQFGVA